MIGVGVYVAEQDRGVVDAVDDDADLAIVKKIAKRRSAPGNDIGQSGALDRWNDGELLPLIEVMEQQRTLGEARAPVIVVQPADTGMAADEQDVLPSVIVIVDELTTPTQEWEVESAMPDFFRDILKNLRRRRLR